MKTELSESIFSFSGNDNVLVITLGGDLQPKNSFQLEEFQQEVKKCEKLKIVIFNFSGLSSVHYELVPILTNLQKLVRSKSAR